MAIDEKVVCKQQPQEWHSYVLMMAKHKCFEKMEQLDKQDTEDLTDDDFHAYKDCAEAIKPQDFNVLGLFFKSKNRLNQNKEMITQLTLIHL